MHIGKEKVYSITFRQTLHYNIKLIKL